VITVNRPAFGTTTQASITVTASLSGGGSETIQRTILNQVKTSFGPSLQVTASVGSSSVTISYSATGTVELSIDGGAWSAAPASPIIVTRDGSDHSYDFRATLDGQTTPGHADVPSTASVSAQTTAVVDRLYVSATNYTTNVVTVSFAYTGSLGGGTFEVVRIRTVGSTADYSGSTSSAGITTGTAVNDNVPDDIISTTGPKVTYSYAVRVKDANGVVLRTTNYLDVTYSTV
jgi:hypothetical protein